MWHVQFSSVDIFIGKRYIWHINELIQYSCDMLSERMFVLMTKGFLKKQCVEYLWIWTNGGFNKQSVASCTTLKAGSDHISFRNQKDNVVIQQQMHWAMHISVIWLKNSFTESETTVWSTFSVQNAAPSLCTVDWTHHK